MLFFFFLKNWQLASRPQIQDLDPNSNCNVQGPLHSDRTTNKCNCIAHTTNRIKITQIEKLTGPDFDKNSYGMENGISMCLSSPNYHFYCWEIWDMNPSCHISKSYLIIFKLYR